MPSFKEKRFTGVTSGGETSSVLAELNCLHYFRKLMFVKHNDLRNTTELDSFFAFNSNRLRTDNRFRGLSEKEK